MFFYFLQIEIIEFPLKSATVYFTHNVIYRVTGYNNQLLFDDTCTKFSPCDFFPFYQDSIYASYSKNVCESATHTV